MKSGLPLSVLTRHAALFFFHPKLIWAYFISSMFAYLGTFCSISPYFRPNRVTSAGPRTAQAVARSGSDGPGAARTQPRQPRSLHRVLRQEEKFGKRERDYAVACKLGDVRDGRQDKTIGSLSTTGSGSSLT